MLLALRPGVLHRLQRLRQAPWLHVRRGVQGPLEVGPGGLFRVEQVRRRGLAVPAPSQVGEPPEQGLPVVPVQIHVGEVRQVPVPRALHGVQGAEDRQREGGVGQGVLAAAHDVHAVADPVGVALRQLADQRRRARALHVGLVDAATHAALQARCAGGLQERFGPVALQAQGLQHLGLALQGLVHGNDVVKLAAAQLDGGGAELALVILFLEDPVPAASRIQAPRFEEVLEGFGGGAGQALAPVLQPELLHPGLQDLGVLGVLRDDAVGGVPDAEPQGPPVAQRAHGHLGLVALGQERGADLAEVLGPEVARRDAAGPGAPLGEGWHRGRFPVAAVEALVARDVVAVGDRPSRLVEVGVGLVAREGHGPVLLDRRLVGVQQLAAAADEEHRSAAPGAELPDLQGGDAPLLPALVADGLGQGELQELGQLPGHAELVVAGLEGAGQDLGAVVELVAYFAEGAHGLPQGDLHLGPVVHDLQSLLGEGPVPGGVVAVHFLADLHDRVAVAGVIQLPQSGLLHAGVGLLVAEAVGLPGEGAVDHGDGEEVVALVGPAGVAAPLAGAGDPHGDVGQPVRVLLAEKRLAQLGEVVVAVGLQ